jgi:carbon storage regulator
MLVLSRKPGEAINIGSGITITVVEVKGSRGRVGIQAPDEVPVLRAELINSMVQQLAELPQ